MLGCMSHFIPTFLLPKWTAFSPSSIIERCTQVMQDSNTENSQSLQRNTFCPENTCFKISLCE
jgi:hypothetical protein